MDAKLREFHDSEQRVLKHLLRMFRDGKTLPSRLCDGLFCFNNCEGLADEGHSELCTPCAEQSTRDVDDQIEMESNAANKAAGEISGARVANEDTLACHDEEQAVKDPEAVDPNEAQEQAREPSQVTALSKSSLQYVLNDPLAERTGSEMRQFETLHGENHLKDLSFRPRLVTALNGMHDYRTALSRMNAIVEARHGQPSDGVLGSQYYGPVTANGASGMPINELKQTSDTHNDAMHEIDPSIGSASKLGGGTKRPTAEGDASATKDDKIKTEDNVPVRRSARIKARSSL